jgi:hypothetical protein
MDILTRLSCLGFLFLGLFTTTIHAMFPVPTVGNLIICFTFECFQDTVDFVVSKDAILVAMISFDISKDNYSALYLGNILNMFDFPNLPVYTVLLQLPEGLNVEEAGSKMIKLITSTKSVFVSYEHGFSSFGLNDLQSMKSLGYGPQVVYHLNHEKPWTNGDHKEDSLDSLYSSTDKLVASYQLHPLVLRNYYFDQLANHSHYLPLGVSYYSFLIGSESHKNSPIALASQRGTRCYFQGRLNYDSIILNDGTEVKDFVESPVNQPQVLERRHLLSLSLANRLGGCVAQEYDPFEVMSENRDMSHVYTAYVEKMKDTAFALCPGGNNPETFRHYEVSR